MNHEDYKLLTYPQILEILEDFFEKNNEIESVKKDYENFIKKYPRNSEVYNFVLGADKSIALNRIFAFQEKVKELSQSFYKIKDCDFDFSIPKTIKELGEMSDELWHYHHKAFKAFDDFETDWKVNISDKEKYVVDWNFYVKLSEYISEAEVLSYIGLALEKYAKENISSNKKQKTKLLYVEGHGISLSESHKLCYTPDKNSDRDGYLRTLIKGNGKLFSAKELNKSINKIYKYPNSGTIISNAISKINSLIKKELKLNNDVILRKKGYRINTEDYEITIDG